MLAALSAGMDPSTYFCYPAGAGESGQARGIRLEISFQLSFLTLFFLLGRKSRANAMWLLSNCLFDLRKRISYPKLLHR